MKPVYNRNSNQMNTTSNLCSNLYINNNNNNNNSNNHTPSQYTNTMNGQYTSSPSSSTYQSQGKPPYLPRLPPIQSCQSSQSLSFNPPSGPPPIPLPNLLNNKNDYEATPILASISCGSHKITPSPPSQIEAKKLKIKRGQKRHSSEMSNETLIKHKGKSPKRQKTEKTKSNHHNNKKNHNGIKKAQKRAQTASNHHHKKFKMAIERLTDFAEIHNGKLPSLRYIMKMLKVGFPKAHEIIDAYALSIGKTKDQVIQDMTVRQENEKGKADKTNKKGIVKKCKMKNKNLKLMVPEFIDNDSTTNSAECSVNYCGSDSSFTSFNGERMKWCNKHSSLPYNFSSTLIGLLDSATNLNDNEWEIYQREYLCDIYNLEIFIKRSVNNKLIDILDLEDTVNIASAYYILAEAYYIRCCNQDLAYKYINKSLETFIKCNCMAIKCGYQPYDDDDNNNNNNNDNEMNGCFWKEIAAVLLLCGEIQLDNDNFILAQKQYELAYNLVNNIKTKDLMIKNEYLWRCLQHLSIVHCYKKDYNLSVLYGEQFFNRMSNHKESNDIEIKNIIVAKAWLATNLMHCTEKEDIEKGKKFYINVLKESQSKIGEKDKCFLYQWYCYFAIHFIRNGQWNEVFNLIENILKINKNLLNIQIIENINEVFNDFIIYFMKMKPLKFIQKRYQNNGVYGDYTMNFDVFIRTLYKKHINFIKDINKNSKEKHDEYLKKNENRKIKKRENKQIDDDQDIDLELIKKFKFNMKMECFYPKIKILSIIKNYICLFTMLNDTNFVKDILNDIILLKSKECKINEKSSYLNGYPIDTIKQNEIQSLLKYIK